MSGHWSIGKVRRREKMPIADYSTTVTAKLPSISEADLKRAVTDFLEIGQSQGRWVYLRLNTGDFIEVRGKTRRRVKGCPRMIDMV